MEFFRNSHPVFFSQTSFEVQHGYFSFFERIDSRAVYRWGALCRLNNLQRITTNFQLVNSKNKNNGI
ncbi:MAG: hypothetical protein CAK90_05505 [Spartobacteria bacterium AMD-G4]|nr:MAG: hypothetical protein CAK90_05505 [Spartobacteria bacterium AMD-G4]